MPYSAVTQPWPLPRRNGGTPSSILAVHSTRVSPNSTSTDPSAWQVKRRVKRTGRRTSAPRPPCREGIFRRLSYPSEHYSKKRKAAPELLSLPPPALSTACAPSADSVAPRVCPGLERAQPIACSSRLAQKPSVHT